MFFTREAMATDRNLQGHWAELWANRAIWNNGHEGMFNANRTAMSEQMMAANNQQFTLNGNALAGLGREFWQEIDNQIIELRDQEIGMEILNDLMGIQTTLSIGKTAKLYQMVGDIADDVSISMDGQAPYSFDQTDYSNDGDPVPIFSAGYGVNWRHAAGLNTVGIDLVLDSQRAKLRKYYKKLINYMLNGAPTIRVDAYPGQGLRNHRNTYKMNLAATGAGALNIDLATASPDQLIQFFGGTGPFGSFVRNNRLARIDVLWVSHEILANLDRPYLINLGGAQGMFNGTVRQAMMPFVNIGEIRGSYALSGNEFLGYVRRKDYVTPLVGMATGTVPLPRPMPQHNFNFQIMGAMGIQVSRDSEGLGGVVYGANLT